SASASSMICNNGRRGALRLDAVCACMLCSAKRAPLFGRGGAAKKRSRFTFMQCSMFAHTRFRLSVTALVALLCLLGAGARNLHAQDVDGTGEDSDDPIKLYQRAQAAQARAQLERALALYDQALKLRPEYPEAEYQKGVVLTVLKRWPEAEKSLRRAAELRSEWALPQTALGLLFIGQQRDKDAEPFLRRALELDAEDETTLVALALLRLRAGDKDEALALYRRATEDESAAADTWAARGSLERASGDEKSAAASLKRALQLDPKNVLAREERAELRAAAGDYAHAVEDIEFLLHGDSIGSRAPFWRRRIAGFELL